ncbi:retrovirus-related pol polyprotein from transposon TNT 1-94 [Tanacetum coccineum]
MHMDLCGSMRVESINGKKYILVIVDDYSRFTWVKFLRSKDEAHEFIIKFLKMIHVRLNATVRNIRTIMKQNLSIKLCVAIMKMSVSLMKHPWRVLHNRMVLSKDETGPYEDLGKLKAKVNVGIFIGYAPAKKAYRNYNRRTRQIMETIHVDFDELTVMASEQSSSRPALYEMNDWDTLLQLLFDEYFSPLPCVDHPLPKVAASEPIVSIGTPSLTTVDQDAPSPSTLQTPQESSSQVISPGVEELDHDIKVAHMDNNHYFGLPIPEPSFEESSS